MDLTADENFLALNVSGGQAHTLQDSNLGEASTEHRVSSTQQNLFFTSLKGASVTEPQIELG